jgi:hypothetical protein
MDSVIAANRTNTTNLYAGSPDFFTWRSYPDNNEIAGCMENLKRFTARPKARRKGARRAGKG